MQPRDFAERRQNDEQRRTERRLRLRRWSCNLFQQKVLTAPAYPPSVEQMRIWQLRMRSLLLLLLLVGLSACAAPVAPPAPAEAAPVATSLPRSTLLRSEPTPVPAAVLARMDTETQLRLVEAPRRDPVRLAVELNPDLDDAPIFAEPKRHRVGDRERFWVHNSDAKQNIEIVAELIYQTDVANVWVELEQPYDARRIRQSIDRFSSDIYPALVNLFGSEWNPGVDGDPRLHILHTTRTGANVAGYFYSADKYTRVVNPFSNEKEIFFINLDWLNRLQDYRMYETVLAHEFQHMIHWNQDRGEDLWLNEGLSEYAQEVAGYAPDIRFAHIYLNNPDLSLTTWSPNPGSGAPHYGAAYLFVAYLAQRFGDDFLGVLVAEPRNGANGVDAALVTFGARETFDDLFADWVAANWADVSEAADDVRFGYHRLSLPKPQAAATYRLTADATAGLGVVETDVANYGVDYLLVEGEGDFIFRFEGATQTQLASTQPFDGMRMWWSNRGDDANSRLTRRFDLSALEPGTPITMTLATWWSIEETYDYGYVMASRDAIDWIILPGQRTRADNPTGNALGPGYTGISGEEAPGWVQETYDLSAFAGGPLWLRFSYVTDDAVNTEGWFLDDLAIPAVGFEDSFEDEVAGWESEGWILTDNRLPQRWLVQALEFKDGRLEQVTRVSVGDDGRATVDLAGLNNRRHIVLAVSGLTRVTTERARYRYRFEVKSD
ncbi:MAG: immune inhibitor A [Caldilinea sp.]|nr:immune inhibitor A [Caldilinea sp.]MDW8440997.1 immune inhibitor A [Caldilineaceae bacterium]